MNSGFSNDLQTDDGIYFVGALAGVAVVFILSSLEPTAVNGYPEFSE